MSLISLPGFKKVFVSILLISAVFCQSPRSAAGGQDRKAVVTTALYGILAGTLMGAVAAPMTHDVRSVFIGSSIGLYLGTAAGLYHITHRHDPGNPFSPESSQWENKNLQFGAPGRLKSSRLTLGFAVPILSF